MKKSIAVLLVMLAATAAWTSITTIAYSQKVDPRTAGISFYERAKRLKENIQEGWIPGDVTAIMGRPQDIRTSFEGSDIIEVWGYDGFEVRIEFRNGLVSNWHFRFMR